MSRTLRQLWHQSQPAQDQIPDSDQSLSLYAHEARPSDIRLTEAAESYSDALQHELILLRSAVEKAEKLAADGTRKAVKKTSRLPPETFRLSCLPRIMGTHMLERDIESSQQALDRLLQQDTSYENEYTREVSLNRELRTLTGLFEKQAEAFTTRQTLSPPDVVSAVAATKTSIDLRNRHLLSSLRKLLDKQVTQLLYDQQELDPELSGSDRQEASEIRDSLRGTVESLMNEMFDVSSSSDGYIEVVDPSSCIIRFLLHGDLITAKDDGQYIKLREFGKAG